MADETKPEEELVPELDAEAFAKALKELYPPENLVEEKPTARGVYGPNPTARKKGKHNGR